MPLTVEEMSVLEKLGQAWNEFYALSTEHPSDPGEFTTAIHAAQNIVMARSAAREHPDFLRRK